MSKPQLLKGIILQVAHNGVKLHHTVRYGSACRKSDSPAAGKFVHILTLHEHIRAFLCVRLRYSRNITHFRIQKEVFIKMTLIHKQPVHAKLLKSHHIVLPLLVVQFLQLCFQ